MLNSNRMLKSLLAIASLILLSGCIKTEELAELERKETQRQNALGDIVTTIEAMEMKKLVAICTDDLLNNSFDSASLVELGYLKKENSLKPGNPFFYRFTSLPPKQGQESSNIDFETEKKKYSKSDYHEAKYSYARGSGRCKITRPSWIVPVDYDKPIKEYAETNGFSYEVVRRPGVLVWIEYGQLKKGGKTIEYGIGIDAQSAKTHLNFKLLN